MSKQPIVSIILPTYNRSLLIKRCVESILSQSYTNWELIISDDGSKDDTASIVKKCLKLDPRIQANFNENNKGLPSNRNIALALSKGELVFFIEDDLILHPLCVETLVNTYNLLSSYNIRIGAISPRLIEDFSPYTYYPFDKGRANKKKLPFVFNKWTGEVFNNYTEDFGDIIETITGHACSLYNAQVVKNVGGYEENAYKGTYKREETDLNFRLSKNGYKFYFQPAATAQHKKIKIGGCRKPNHTAYYYSVINHIKFLIRIFGIKSTYMVPCFLLVFNLRIIKQTLFRWRVSISISKNS